MLYREMNIFLDQMNLLKEIKQPTEWNRTAESSIAAYYNHCCVFLCFVPNILLVVVSSNFIEKCSEQ